MFLFSSDVKKQSCTEVHLLYPQNFWKFCTFRIGADLASQLKNQQYHCRIWLNKIPGLAVIIITRATSLRPLLARNRARHNDSDWEIGTTSPISLERALVFHVGWKPGNWNPAVSRKWAKVLEVCVKAPLKLLHFDRCVLGKVLMPCRQKHFFMFVLRTETACVGLWEQCVIQHCHPVCCHMPAKACCMLETWAGEAYMFQQTQDTVPRHWAQYISF